MFSIDEIRSRLLRALPDANVEVRDLTGTSDHFEVYVVSDAFEGKNTLARHRAVYSALGPEVGAEIHALSIKAWTPAEEKE